MTTNTSWWPVARSRVDWRRSLALLTGPLLLLSACHSGRPSETAGSNATSQSADEAAAASSTDEADQPSASGATDRSERLEPRTIYNITSAEYPQFRKCYEEGLARNSELRGRVVIRFIIDLDGKVIEARSKEGTEDPLRDEKTEQCILQRFSALAFPPRQLDPIMTVEFPLRFEPNDADRSP